MNKHFSAVFITFMLLCLFFLILSLFSCINDLHYETTPSTTPAQTRVPTRKPLPTNTPEPIIATIKSGVNIRAGNDKTTEKLGYAKAGETYLVVTPFYERTKWHQIEYNGRYAFIFSDYCTLSQDITIPTPTPTIAPGTTVSNPIEISAENLSKSVEKDIDAAKRTYCWRYVRISGKIIDNDSYRTRSYNGKRNAYSYEDHVIYWFSNNALHAWSKLIPIKVIMKDVSVCHGKGNTIEIVGYVSSIDEHTIIIERAVYAPTN